jgi:hypothetical protein
MYKLCLKTSLASFFIFIFSGCFQSLKSLSKDERTFPMAYCGPGNPGAVEQGYIVLMNNDTLKGRIKLTPCGGTLPILPLGKQKADDIHYINRDDINCIRLYKVFDNDPCKLDKQYTDFEILSDGGVWRLLAQKNDIKFYDDYNGPISEIITMALVVKNERINLYSTWAYTLHFDNPKPLVLRFINKRYKTSFHRNDFKTEADMINYILDKENEKLKADTN